MHTIEIDFDVFKGLTNLRENETVTYNHVLRRLLKLPESQVAASAKSDIETSRPADLNANAWVSKGVAFPDGTEFRANYKGQTIYAKIAAGKFVVNGETASSPSDAARIVTGNSVNGWNFWHCRLPGQSHWRGLQGMKQSR